MREYHWITDELTALMDAFPPRPPSEELGTLRIIISRWGKTITWRLLDTFDHAVVRVEVRRTSPHDVVAECNGAICPIVQARMSEIGEVVARINGRRWVQEVR